MSQQLRHKKQAANRKNYPKTQTSPSLGTPETGGALPTPTASPKLNQRLAKNKKKNLEKKIKVIKVDNNNILAVKLDKTCLNTEEDILLVTLYAHPIHSPYYKLKDNENTLDKLSDFMGDYMDESNNENILVLSDAKCQNFRLVAMSKERLR